MLNLFYFVFRSRSSVDDIEVVNVDLLRGQDLLDSAVWHFLLQFVRSGRVVAVLAGPPCRTVSAARYIGLMEDRGL